MNKVIYMEGLFYDCSSLKELPNISKWNINSDPKLNKLIDNYSKEISDKIDIDLKNKIEEWIRLHVITNMSYLFYGCKSLKELPDISKWDLSNVMDISHLFCGCLSLEELPDISKWNTRNVKDLNGIFENCSSLTFIPDISKWKFKNKININNIFRGCKSLKSLPDISKWNLKYSSINQISSQKNTKASEDWKYNNDSSSLKGDNNKLYD